jgi:hypothetical protein
MWAGGRAFARGRIIVSVTFFGLMLGGCGPFLPGFWAHAWVHKVPVSRVATTVRCELKEFLDKHNSQAKLVQIDTSKVATVSLTLQEDHTGGVTYIGIDLNRLGFTSLAELVAAQNKAPNLQAGLQGKSQVSSKVEFKLSQDPRELGQDCVSPANSLLVPLSLGTWLEEFFKGLDKDGDELATACMTRISLKTQFQLGVSIKGGANPFFGPAFILPISGLNFEYSPAFTHTLEVIFVPKSKGNNRQWCKKAREVASQMPAQ